MRRLHRPHHITARRALVLIAIVTISVTLGAGIVMWLVDRSAYPTVGAGLWWALQTVTTVGYGDQLPDNRPGRAVAATVMVFGIAFLTVATATVTAMFIESARSRLAEQNNTEPNEDVAGLREEIELLRRDLRRLTDDR